MPQIHDRPSPASRLRFVFDDAEVSFNLTADATFGEVASRLAELLKRRRGKPVAMNVTLSPVS